MSEFSTKINQLQSSVQEEVYHSSELDGIEDKIRYVKSNLRWKISAEAGIQSRLSKLAEKATDHRKGMESLRGALDQSLALYQMTEKKLCGNSADQSWLEKLIGDGIDDLGKNLASIAAGALAGGVASIIPGLQAGAIGKEVADKVRENFEDSGSDSISVAKGSLEVGGNILGKDAELSLEGELLGASYEKKLESGITIDKDGNIDSLTLLEAELGGEAHLAKGSASGSWGRLSGNASAAVGVVSAVGTIGASLFKDGKFAPQIGAKAEAKAVAAQGEVEGKYGSEDFNAHGKAEGELGTASAYAETQVGLVTYKDKNGNEVTGWGAKGEVGAEAYLATGKVSGGYTIFGIDIDVGLEGKVGGAGVTAGGGVTTGGIGGSVSLGAGLGLGLDVSIDWTDCVLWKKEG